jgi:hypothetical protein
MGAEQLADDELPSNSSRRSSSDPPGGGRAAALLATGLAGMLVVLIMLVGSLGLWIAVPLLWLWVGAQAEGATGSVGAGFGVALPGAVLTIGLVALLLARLSGAYRANRAARGLTDNGHAVLESVLILSAGVTVLAFAVWFLFLAGASPLPLGLQI